MDWKAYLDDQSQALAKFRRERPDTGRAFTSMHHASMSEGSLTVREKELIALAIGISKQCVDCIGYHVQAAAKAGASRDDISDVISIAVYMGGGPAYMYAVKALEAYDQLCE